MDFEKLRENREIFRKNPDVLSAVKSGQAQNSGSNENQIASQQEIITVFENAYKNIKGFHKRLLFFSLSKIRLYFHSDTFRNMAADDVVQDVIDKILTGKRKWNKVQIPCFHDFIRIAILSYIRNEYKRIEKIETTELDEGDSKDSIDYREYSEASLRDVTEDAIFRESLEVLLGKLETLLKDDIFAVFVLEERMNGNKSNIKIAEKLGIEVNEVEKALKRIKSKLPKILSKK